MRFSLKQKLSSLLVTSFCVGTFLVPTYTSTKAETIKFEHPIGFATNVVTTMPPGETFIFRPVLNTDFLTSDQINFVRHSDMALSISPGTFYDSYIDLAKKISREWKNRTRIRDEGEFFLSDLDKNFASLLSEKQWATQFYYYYSYYYSEYSLTLENGAYFVAAYSDQYDPDFLSALDRLADGELSYPEFFDSFGTHVITGVNYGTKIEAYYGAFLDQFLKREELQEIEASLSASLDDYLQNGGIFSLDSSITAKYGITESVSRITRIDPLENGEYTVVGFSNLLPLYNILPEEYAALAEPMRQAFSDYADANTELYENSSLPLPSDSSDTSDGSETPPDDDGGNEALKIILICSACVVVLAAAAAGLIVWLHKKKKK